MKAKCSKFDSHKFKNFALAGLASLNLKSYSFCFLAVYLSRIPLDEKGGYDSVDWSKYPASLGYTLELCAGIIDKNKPLVQIAQEEVLEECGYSVPLAKLERITSYRYAHNLIDQSFTIDRSIRIHFSI